MFYYYNGRLPLLNGLLSAPDGETPFDSEKISLKSLYEMFKDTKSHGIVSVQLLLALSIFFFFFGGDASLAKDTMTELYKNLSFETLCRNQNTEFEKVPDLNAHINFTMKHSILSNIDKKNHLMVKTIYCLT